jgi:trypsin
VTVWGVVHIEASATISPGNSGGPLLNDRGEAVGVVSKLRTADDRRWALAIPVNYISGWLPEGRSARGWGWERRVAEAARAVEPDLKHFESARRRPMLLGAHYVRYVIDSRSGEYGMGQLVFVVAGPAAAQGGEPAQLTVRLTCGDTRPKETALSPWMSIDARPERSPRLDVNLLRPFAAWARKRSLGGTVVVGSGETWIDNPNRCRNGELTLLDGGAVADRVTIE